MRHFFRFIVVCIMMTFGFQLNALAADDCKICVVDMQKFQENSNAFKKVRETLRQKFNSLQQKLDNEKNELLKVEEEFNKQKMMLSLDAKEDKQRDLEKKRRHYKYLYDEYTLEIKETEMELRRTVGKELESVVEQIGKKKNYTIILEKRALGLLYHDKTIDITDEVTEAYDRIKK